MKRNREFLYSFPRVTVQVSNPYGRVGTKWDLDLAYVSLNLKEEWELEDAELMILTKVLEVRNSFNVYREITRRIRLTTENKLIEVRAWPKDYVVKGDLARAAQMMGELRDVAATSGISCLDEYADKARYGREDGRNTVLTTHKDVTEEAPPNPGHPLSGNADERFSRQVVVLRVLSNESARRVVVRVYREPAHELLAETVDILRSEDP